VRALHMLNKGRLVLSLAAVPVVGMMILAGTATSAQASSAPQQATHASTPQHVGASAPTPSASPSATAPSAASADPPCSDAGDFCFWVNANYGGALGLLAGTNPWWGDFPQSECVYPAAAKDADGTWNDCASSGYNDGTSGDAVVVYQNINYGGEDACLPDLSAAYSDFADYTYGDGSASLNDSISSNSWTPAGDCG
jgi:hypothetical protein